MKNNFRLSFLFKKVAFVASLLLIIAILFAFRSRKKPKILVFSKTTGFVHSCIPVGNAAIVKLGMENGFDVDTTKEAGVFNNDNLGKYAAIVFLNTTEGKEDLLNENQKNALIEYMHKGGGWMGIHAATDAGYRWPWYLKLSGAYFFSHPKQQEATINVVDASHISTKHLPAKWVRADEWYNFREMNKDVKVLLKIDEKSYTGGANGDDHPMAWYHDYDGGRAFYTELGHTEISYADPLYLKHILGGIQYAMGVNKKGKRDRD